MADGDDLPPPLEDMTEAFEKLQAFKSNQNTYEKSSSKTAESTSKSTGTIGVSAKPVQSISKDIQSKPTSAAAANTGSNSGKFAGMKKGFLFGSSSGTPKKVIREKDIDASSSSTTSKVNAEEIPFVKPSLSKEEELKMPEVQSAMKSAEHLLQNKDWVSEDLLTKVQKDPTLMKAFSNPEFSNVVEELKVNPQAAMAKYGHMPEFRAFLQNFSSLMGEHFTGIADSQPKTSPEPLIREAKAEDQSGASSSEQRQMQDILSRPEVKEALSDERVMHVIETLRSSPQLGHRLLSSLPPEVRRKIQVLVQNGLLALQSS